MHDSSKYPNPDEFDGFRFLKKNAAATISRTAENPMQGSTFTDVSKDYPIWGIGSKAWYALFHGIFYSALLM